MNVVTLTVGSLSTNSYLVFPQEGGECSVVDPGGEADGIAQAITTRRLTPTKFLVTHCHADHIVALAELKARYKKAAIVVPKLEAEWLRDPLLNLSWFLGLEVKAPPADVLVEGGDALTFGGRADGAFCVLHLPGHTPGGVAYLWPDKDGPLLLFSGDTLFASGIGRSDFPGGDEGMLLRSIREKLYILPEETIIYPGHGEPTTIGREKHANPYV